MRFSKQSLVMWCLIAGKGHETYQEICGVRYDFDDREVAREALKEKYGEERINENEM